MSAKNPDFSGFFVFLRGKYAKKVFLDREKSKKAMVYHSFFCYLLFLVFIYYFNYFSYTNHLTATELESIPIPAVSEELQRPIILLVEQILEAKRTNPQADTSALEGEIDRLVYGLYGLSEEEIAVVEGR